MSKPIFTILVIVAMNLVCALTADAANDASGDASFIGGGFDNTASGTASFVGGGTNNVASENFGVVAGGRNNRANGNNSTVAGGIRNIAASTGCAVGGGRLNLASNDFAIVGGGLQNIASNQFATVAGGGANTAAGTGSFVGGGDGNTASGLDSTVAGGADNTASNKFATVSGGTNNLAGGEAATVGGGFRNTTRGFGATVGGGVKNLASGQFGTVSGGTNNTASGAAATIPGGSSNVAQGSFSFAAGRLAKALHDGAFVWGDSTGSPMESTAVDQFTARASGGVRFLSTASGTVGVSLAPGGNAWRITSDCNDKENFKPVDVRALLEKVVAMPVTEWNLKSQDPVIRHIGPMAQDFKAAFAVGEDDKHISTSDADGVAFAAIQGLYQMMQGKEKEIAELRKENTALADGLRELKAQMQQVTEKLKSGGF